MNWRYYWRRYAGWFPVQFCMICGKPYWGGMPTFEWQAWMADYCSRECCDIDIGLILNKTPIVTGSLSGSLINMALYLTICRLWILKIQIRYPELVGHPLLEVPDKWFKGLIAWLFERELKLTVFRYTTDPGDFVADEIGPPELAEISRRASKKLQDRMDADTHQAMKRQNGLYGFTDKG